MANVDTLKEKVEKAELKVKKCKGTIARHEKQLQKKIDRVVGLGIDITKAVDFTKLDDFKWGVNRNESSEYCWELCDVEGKARDIIGANKKLKEAEIILSNWKEKLNKELEKENFLDNNTPQVIEDFLEEWKQKAYDWNIKRFIDLKHFKIKLADDVKVCKIKYIKANPEQFKMYLNENDELDEYWLKNLINVRSRGLEKHLIENYLDWKSIDRRIADFAGKVVLHMCTIYDEDKRLKWLDDILKQEKKNKMIDLINRINEITGTITDAKDLSVGVKGNLDGIIIGENGSAKIQTISAGGWNIQCFHFRILVDKI